MDSIDPHLRTNKISSRVAPASSAARMWCRVPSGSRFVQAAFRLTLTSSINLRVRTECVHGLVLILKHSSAHFGSHSRSVFRAESHGPVGRSVTASAFCLYPVVSLMTFPPAPQRTVCKILFTMAHRTHRRDLMEPSRGPQG